MSNLDDHLLLHLKLDDTEAENRLKDSSRYKHNAVLNKAAAFVLDSTLGKRIQPSEDQKNLSIGVTGSTENQNLTENEGDVLTISTWIHTGQGSEQHVRIGGLKGNPVDLRGQLFQSWEFHWQTLEVDGVRRATVNIWNSMPQRESSDGYRKTIVAQSRQSTSVKFEVDAEAWFHVTAFIGGNIPMIYVHDVAGALIARPNSNTSSGGGTHAQTYMSEVTYLQTSAYLPDGGGIAHLRLHQCEIGEDQVKQLIRQDLGGTFKAIPVLLRIRKQVTKVETSVNDSAFVPNELPTALHPVDFSLFDQNDQQLLFIRDDPNADHQLLLELHNSSSRDIEFLPGDSDKASSDNYHLELRFRPATLSKETLARFAEADAAQQILGEHAGHWDLQLARPSEQAYVSLYLLKIDGRGYQDGLTLPLRYMSAEQGSGTRLTRVELRLGRLRYQGSDELIICRRSVSLQVMYGLPQYKDKLPIHAGFPGSSTLLNDGETPNSLQLQITNITGQDLQSPMLELLFDVGDESQWWALCSKGDLDSKEIKIDAKWPNDTDWVDAELPSRNQKLDTGRRVISGKDKSDKDKVLLAGQHVVVRLSGIKTQRSGSTQLHVDYYNIPGHQPGRISCAVERSALVSEGGKIGIGMQPEEKLDVQGAIQSSTIKTWSVISKTMIQTPELQSGSVITNSLRHLNPGATLTVDDPIKVTGDLTVEHDLIVQETLRGKRIKAEELGFTNAGRNEGFSKVDGIDGADNPNDMHRLATTHYVKWLLGVKEHPATFPDENFCHNYYPPLTCYEFPDGQLRLIGKFYFTQDLNGHREKFPRINGLKNKIAGTQFVVGKGTWMWWPDGIIGPLGWKFDADDRIISVNVSLRMTKG
jgi:hypothetical protein